MPHVLTFLQELMDKGCTPSTLKVYMAAIAANHALVGDQSVGKNNFVVIFLRGARRMNPPHPYSVLTWVLSIVLGALRGPPFEPLHLADLLHLSLKTALLLALASVK